MPKTTKRNTTLAIGRIVTLCIPRGHPRWGEDVPAIITEIADATSQAVHLQPFCNAVDAPLPPAACMNVRHSEDKKSGHWRWPE